jgi:hypothetical protein
MVTVYHSSKDAIILILHLGKVRHREFFFKVIVHDHTTSKWWRFETRQSVPCAHIIRIP